MTEKICILCNEEKAVKKHSYCLKCVRAKNKKRNLDRYNIKPYKGSIYVVSNPAWNNWVKVGRALDVEKRIHSYNTSSPFRDYEIVFCTKVDNPIVIERHFFEKYGNTYNEWFNISADEAIYEIKKIKNNGTEN